MKLSMHLVERCAPLRLRACHGMYPPSRSVATLIRPVLLGLMSLNMRQHTVMHEGTPTEHAYGMAPSGIPVEFGGTCVF
jgi:hypothetical protein